MDKVLIKDMTKIASELDRYEMMTDADIVDGILNKVAYGKIKRYNGSDTFTYDDEETGVSYDVEYEYEGYYDPGVCSGPVERCYPPEGEHNVKIISITPEPTLELKKQIEDAVDKESRKHSEAIE